MFQKGYTPWNKGKKYSPAICKQMSKIAKGINTWSKGKKHSELTKEKIRNACKGCKSYNWKGGKVITKTGYILINTFNHPFTKGTKKRNYIYEHRFVMEQCLGRCLKRNEVVHHINGIKYDNRIKNLMLFKSESQHQKYPHKNRHNQYT
jgi:hypothetical protein